MSPSVFGVGAVVIGSLAFGIIMRMRGEVRAGGRIFRPRIVSFALGFAPFLATVMLVAHYLDYLVLLPVLRHYKVAFLLPVILGAGGYLIITLLFRWFGATWGKIPMAPWFVRTFFSTVAGQPEVQKGGRMALEIKGRVTGRMYWDIPPGHRTTFVTAMCDMLQVAVLYADTRHAPRLEAMLAFAGPLKSDDLRQRFDIYLNEKQERLTHGAAAEFINALNAWSGFDK